MSQKGGAVNMRVPIQFLMQKESAIKYLDMDEMTFERFIIPMVARLKFGTRTFFLTDQLEEAVISLAEMSITEEE